MLPAALDEGENGALGERFQTLDVLPETVKTFVVARTSLFELLERGGIGTAWNGVRVGG